MFQIRKENDDWYAPHRDILNIMPEYIKKALKAFEDKLEKHPELEKDLDKLVFKFMDIHLNQIFKKDFPEVEGDFDQIINDPLFVDFLKVFFKELFKFYYVELRSYTLKSEQPGVIKELKEAYHEIERQLGKSVDSTN